MAGINTESVQRLYVAYFNRPADPSAWQPTKQCCRLIAWRQAELEEIANTYFSPSAEYTANYSGKSNAGIVNQLYLNIFGREAEPDGLIHWGLANKWRSNSSVNRAAACHTAHRALMPMSWRIE